MKPDFTVGIIQSNYIPWRGYFDFIRQCDLFVIYDDTQYTKGDWRNRNKIKTAQGLRWLTVPVSFRISEASLIENTKINYSIPWVEEHKGCFQAAYGESPYFKTYRSELFDLLDQHYESISELNFAMISWVNKILDIKTPIVFSREFSPVGRKTDRVLDVLVKTHAKVYLSGPAAKSYLEEEKFAELGITLKYKSYSYPEYPQLHGKFEGAVTVLDLIFMCGPDAKKYL